MDKKEDAEHIIKLLSERKHFCFQRFNDGELKALIHREGKVISRGDQIVDSELINQLREAIKYEAPNYWKGMPCSKCFKKCAELANQLIREDYPYKTLATLLVNDNWPHIAEKMLQTISNSQRPVWIISGDNQNWNNFLKKYKINFVRQITVPSKNSWYFRNKVLEEWKNLPEDSIVLLSCGPLSRVIGWKWWSNFDKCTIIDCGTAYDYYTKGIKRGFMKIDKDGFNNSFYCPICSVRGKL